MKLSIWYKNLVQLEKGFENEKRDILRETADYLQIPKYMDKTKKSLAHLIICRIQNLLPDNCTICEERYRINLFDKPILECAVCGQGVHEKCWLQLASVMSPKVIPDSINAEDFEKLYNPLNIPGIFYVCNVCRPTTIPNDETGNYKRRKHTLPNTPTPSQKTTNSQDTTELPKSLLEKTHCYQRKLTGKIHPRSFVTTMGCSK